MNIIAVVGTKNTGKTTLVTKIVTEMVNRGYHVGTVKHSHHGFDLPEKDTGKHRAAGAEIVAGSGNGTFFNLAEEMDIESILNIMKFVRKLDFVILEGFKEVEYAKISTSNFNDDFTIAQVNVMETAHDPKIPADLVDLVEDRSFGMIQELNCKKCGFQDCKEFVTAKLSGNAPSEIQCKTESDQVLLKVNDRLIPLNPFIRSFIDETVAGMVNSLKTQEFGVKKIEKIELLIRK